MFYNWIRLGDNNYQTKLFLFFVILRGIWNIRNKMRFEKKFLKSSNDVFQIFPDDTEMVHSFERARYQVCG